MERGTNSKENVLVVVAIDFGTTYSGWAYSFRKEYKENHTNIKTKGGWKNFDGQATEKTPTVALFTPEDKFHSFGYEAENKYAELVDEEQSTGWKYFKRFKMALLSDDTKQFGHQQRKLVTGKISRHQKLKDVNGKKITIFNSCFRMSELSEE
ncbi:unnamed protein product [Mytilus edulis]|uniref:Uncharacterized protein n=1 Tax=Mytilus edulis TaxID=6550 RepID=A0A8S3QMF6_MYTED|nr:unnamed protein product [Mytilus edulis]